MAAPGSWVPALERHSCPCTFQLLSHCTVALLTTAVRLPPAPGVGNLCAVGEGTPAVANAAIALEWHIVTILVAFGTERARVNGRDSADLLLALGQH